jgi:hypothetical protein
MYKKLIALVLLCITAGQHCAAAGTLETMPAKNEPKTKLVIRSRGTLWSNRQLAGVTALAAGMLLTSMHYDTYGRLPLARKSRL